jgi:tetratricopeptide (TPR) repeat protein
MANSLFRFRAYIVPVLFLLTLSLPSFAISPQVNMDRILGAELEKSALTGHFKYLDAGDEALHGGDYRKALSSYFKFLSYAKPQQKQIVWDDLGYLFLQTGEPAQCRSYCEMAINTVPHDFNPHLYMAAACLFQDDITAAGEQLDLIETQIHFDGSWLDTLGDAPVNNWKGEKTSPDELEYLRPEQGVLIRPDNRTAYAEDKALFLDAFDKRNIPLYHALRGLLLDRKGKKIKAKESYSRALENAAGREGLSSLLKKLAGESIEEQGAAKQDGWSDILAGITSNISHSFGGHPTNLLWRIDQRFLKELRLGSLQKAKETLLEGLTVDGTSYSFNHNMALLSYDEGDLDKARYFCARTLFFKPDAVPALDLMGNILYLGKDFTRAREYFQRALQHDPDNEFCLYSSGACSYHMEERAKAEDFWNKAIGDAGESRETDRDKDGVKDPLKEEVLVRNLTILFLSNKALGRLCLEEERIPEAVHHLKKALLIREEDPETLFLLGKSLAWLGSDVTRQDIEAAISHLEKHIFLGGRHSKEAEELLEILRRMIRPPGGQWGHPL